MENEIILIYNSKKQRDRETLGYAKSLEDYKLNERDISKDNLTEQQIAEIASDLNTDVASLVDKNDEKYMAEMKGGDFSKDELLKLMNQNPSLITTPIAYLGKKIAIVKSPYNFIREDLEIDGIKSSKGNKFEK
ncbi:MAG: hypothetical protein R3345_11655 [Fulvivirga sp.]|nr:hypothetical protein [Fulvivirga sp.]